MNVLAEQSDDLFNNIKGGRHVDIIKDNSDTIAQ